MNTKPNHTSGPWKYENGRVYIGHFDLVGIYVGRESWGQPVAPLTPEDDVNGRLIASAPELLAALQKMVWLNNTNDIMRGAGVASPSCWPIDDQTRRQQAMSAAVAALAKAKGETTL